MLQMGFRDAGAFGSGMFYNMTSWKPAVAPRRHSAGARELYASKKKVYIVAHEWHSEGRDGAVEWLALLTSPSAVG